VDDSPGIRYEWRGGELVKSVDGESVERMGDLSFSPGPWYGSPRAVVAAGVAAVAVALLVLGIRLRTRRGAGK
jgi:hypothetical protein